MRIGLVVHTGRDDSVDAATEAARVLEGLGVGVVAVRQDDDVDRLEVPTVDPGSFASDLDLALSFGGDGTFLRAAHLCRDAGVPILGLNLGRLGFLAEVERDHLDETLRVVAAGDFVVEERATLRSRAHGPDGGELADDWALNEVSIEKTARQRVLLLELEIGGSRFARIPADALVVATPTGSTAYAFSAGGPILSPEVRALLVTPVAPHSLFGRTVVAGESEQLDVHILPDQEPAVVSCDGRAPVTVPAGGTVTVVGGAAPVRLARVHRRDFYGIVREKFGLQ